MTDAGRLATAYILLSARSDSLTRRGMLFVCLIYYQNIRELTSVEIAIISFYVWVHHSTCTFRLFFNSLQVITIWSWRSCCKVPIFLFSWKCCFASVTFQFERLNDMWNTSFSMLLHRSVCCSLSLWNEMFLHTRSVCESHNCAILLQINKIAQLFQFQNNVH